jgi:hypothetical protein
MVGNGAEACGGGVPARSLAAPDPHAWLGEGSRWLFRATGATTGMASDGAAPRTEVPDPTRRRRHGAALRVTWPTVITAITRVWGKAKLGSARQHESGTPAGVQDISCAVARRSPPQRTLGDLRLPSATLRVDCSRVFLSEAEGEVGLRVGQLMESLHADFSLHWDHEPRRANGPLSLTLSPSEGERGLPGAQRRRFMGRAPAGAGRGSSAGALGFRGTGCVSLEQAARSQF